MFTINDSFELRVKKINYILEQDPIVAFNLAFIQFNWTVKRIIIALSKVSSIILKENLKKIIDAPSLKAIWKKEVSDPFNAPSLSKITTRWDMIKKAYTLNEKIQLGQCSNCEKEITEAIVGILEACKELNNFCQRNKIQIYNKIPAKNLRYVKVI